MQWQKGDKVFSLQIILLQFCRQVFPWMSLRLCPKEAGCVCMCFTMTEKEMEVVILAFDVYYNKMANAEMLSFTKGASLSVIC